MVKGSVASEDPFAKAAAKEIKKLSKKQQQKLELKQYRAEVRQQQEESSGVSTAERRAEVAKKKSIKEELTELKRRRSKLSKRCHTQREARMQLKKRIQVLEKMLNRQAAVEDKGMTEE